MATHILMQLVKWATNKNKTAKEAFHNPAPSKKKGVLHVKATKTQKTKFRSTSKIIDTLK